MPTYTAAEAALAVAQRALQQVRHRPLDPRGPKGPVVDEAVAALLAGEPLPGEMGARIRDAQEAVVVTNLEIEAMKSIVEHLQVRRAQAHVAEADAGLEVLSDELERILTVARSTFGDLDGVADAQAAIDAGPAAVAAWSTVAPLALRYAELRDVQAYLVGAVLEPPENPARNPHATPAARRLVDTFGTVENYVELFPKLQPWEMSEHQQSAAMPGGGRRVLDDIEVVTTKTVRPLRERPWLTGDPVADLRWIAGPEARPWVPAIAELDAAREEAAKYRHEVAQATLRSQPPPEWRPGDPRDRRNRLFGGRFPV